MRRILVDNARRRRADKRGGGWERVTLSGDEAAPAIDAMRELGYDLTTHHSKALDDVPAGLFDATVTMGCGDACPHVPARLREDWQIPDPRDMAADDFRKVRDLIEQKVKELLARL